MTAATALVGCGASRADPASRDQSKEPLAGGDAASRTLVIGLRVRQKRAGARSAPRVVAEALPIDDDAGLIADDPSVMAWCHRCEVTGAILHFFAIVHHDLHAA